MENFFSYSYDMAILIYGTSWEEVDYNDKTYICV